jgi:hypothetical protein
MTPETQSDDEPTCGNCRRKIEFLMRLRARIGAPSPGLS